MQMVLSSVNRRAQGQADIVAAQRQVQGRQVRTPSYRCPVGSATLDRWPNRCPLFCICKVGRGCLPPIAVLGLSVLGHRVLTASKHMARLCRCW